MAAASRLAPPQEAYARYTHHATRCWACRDIDQRCSTGEQLYRAWRQRLDRAAHKVSGCD
ncbi:hypothetical protein ACIG0D_27090 [Streptomyces sp. NPDC052773]|uniref:hypothetical protein n=1 Tax=unclassified Streptomyces TaxID=2593676 RepID=UPI00140D1A06|nr:hypothetical protein [Streptomyces sp. JB150]QIJ61385.1 hypothetical protein G7Z13_04550 [Streptomyces sp. JB150]